ncbi:hypothetical protein CRYUN_Cryun26dG0128600 [Craigia yunnanensis]
MLSSEMLISLDQGTMEVLLEHLDQDQINQIDVTKLTGKQYHQSATSNGEGADQAIQECLLPEASIVSYAAIEKAEKKRKIDKAYRERCKMKQQQMTEENKNFKTENESLREKIDCLTQMLHSQTKELNEHRNRLDNLKFENGKLHLENMLLKVQIDALCGKIVDENNKKFGHQ